MAALNVLATTDFSGVVLNDITEINYTNTLPRSLFTATFAASQFDDVQISSTVAVNGSTGRNAIVVNGSNVNGSGWVFSNWNFNDTVTINGTAAFDILIGTPQDDRIYGYGADDEITGGLGLDTINGGSGDDTIRYSSVAELVAGEVINGGAGTGDRLVLEGPLNAVYDFKGCTISGVEVLEFEGGGRVELTGAQVGGAGITTFISTLIDNTLDVTGQFVSMAGVTFSNWDEETDQIWLKAALDTASVLQGGALRETFYGSSQADTISGNGGDDSIIGGKGADILDGGEGEDRFSYTNSNEMETGETVNGGDGIDTIAISRGGTHSVWKLALTSIEQLSFGFLAGQIIVDGSQIGAQAGLINKVGGGMSFDSLVVLGPAADLSGVTFANWSKFDSITIQGKTDAANTLTGSALADTITGGDLDDVIVGGKGVDVIIGGLGKDILTGGNQGDIFVFNSAAEAGLGALRDRITDLSVGNDIIDLSGIDAISGGGDDAFAFIGTDAFTAAGQLRFFVNAGGNTVIQGNTGGGLGAEFEILLNGTIALTIDEFIL